MTFGAVSSSTPALASNLPDATKMRQFGWAEIFLLALVFVFGSILQFPGSEMKFWVRPLVAISEYSSVAMMYRLVSSMLLARRYLFIFLVFVVLRFVYGWIIAVMQYMTNIYGSFQEGRFGFSLIITPMAFIFFRNASIKNINRLLICYILIMVLVDVIVYSFFVRGGVLALGARSSQRFMLSVMIPIVLIWVRLIITIQHDRSPTLSEFGAIILLSAHVALLTTSRVELVMCSSVLAFWLHMRARNLRWPLVGTVLVVVYYVISYAIDQGTRIAGRDYSMAIYYAIDAFPIGVGIVPEATQQSQLGRASDFFSSDYGIIVPIYRYGLAGMVIAAGLMIFWLRFTLRSMNIPGNIFIAGGSLLYLATVPLLDYGAMNGGMLLGAMAAVAASAPQLEGIKRLSVYTGPMGDIGGAAQQR